MRTLDHNCSWKSFQAVLEEQMGSMSTAQRDSVGNRIEMLKSFVSSSRIQNTGDRFCAGQITIVDLSDALMDRQFARVLFQVTIRLFMRAELRAAKVVVANNAHQYLSELDASTSLGRTLLHLVRNSRDMDTRIIFNTEEPTVLPPTVFELCSMTIMHQFSSQKWWEYLRNNTSLAFNNSCTLEFISRLPKRSMIVLSPSAVITVSDGNHSLVPKRLGCGYMIVTARRCVTQQGRT